MRVVYAILGFAAALVVFAVALPLLIVVGVVSVIAILLARRDDDIRPRRRELDVAA